jgi:hypothetical protein
LKLGLQQQQVEITDTHNLQPGYTFARQQNSSISARKPAVSCLWLLLLLQSKPAAAD